MCPRSPGGGAGEAGRGPGPRTPRGVGGRGRCCAWRGRSAPRATHGAAPRRARPPAGGRPAPRHARHRPRPPAPRGAWEAVVGAVRGVGGGGRSPRFSTKAFRQRFFEGFPGFSGVLGGLRGLPEVPGGPRRLPGDSQRSPEILDLCDDFRRFFVDCPPPPKQEAGAGAGPGGGREEGAA